MLTQGIGAPQQRIFGTPTNDDALPGDVGEYIQSTLGNIRARRVR